MKFESLADIIKALKPILTAKIVFYATLVLAIVFWTGFLFPQSFDFFGLDSWRAQNDAVMGWGVIAANISLVIIFLVNIDNWVSRSLRKRREERHAREVFQNPSREELLYLYQYIRHKTALVEFDERDPAVGLLTTKGLIYPSMHGRIIFDNVRYNCGYDEGEPFEISPLTRNYLVEHPELFSKLPHRR